MSLLLRRAEGVYLPVGVCSKNDKGECINEFNIFVGTRVSVPIGWRRQ